MSESERYREKEKREKKRIKFRKMGTRYERKHANSLQCLRHFVLANLSYCEYFGSLIPIT